MMAWHALCNTVGVRFSLSLLIASLAMAAVCDAQEIAGRWEGIVDVPGGELTLIIDLGQGNGGVWSGSVTSPDLNLKGIAAANLRVEPPEVSFALNGVLTPKDAAPPQIRARVDEGGKLRGEFVQGGNRANFALARTGPPQVEAPRRSTAIVPELEGTWFGSYELLGYARKVTLKLRNRGAEGAAADFVIVGRRENILPVDYVAQEGDFLIVDSSATGLGFTGRMGKGALEGTITQGALDIPVQLKKETK
jgi:hypothetical protein